HRLCCGTFCGLPASRQRSTDSASFCESISPLGADDRGSSAQLPLSPEAPRSVLSMAGVGPCLSRDQRRQPRSSSSSERTLGTMKVTDYNLAHRGRVGSGTVTRTQRRSRGGALENV